MLKTCKKGVQLVVFCFVYGKLEIQIQMPLIQVDLQCCCTLFCQTLLAVFIWLF